MCSAVVCVDLALGLWPLHAPRNDVTWLKRIDGVAFGKYGTMIGKGALNGSRSGTGSVEIWLQPDRWTGSTFFALYNPEKRVLFTLHQSSSDLVVKTNAARNWQFYVDDAFLFALRRKAPVFVSVISGEHGTRVFLDGVLAKSAPEFSIPIDAFAGRPIVGDSPRRNDSFRGKILGLAIYNGELSAGQVLQHYRSWTKNARADLLGDECSVALYLFNERTGDLIHNFSDSESDLVIPRTYGVIDKLVFEPFWEEFEMSANYWRGNLKNIVGFLPVGFCFYAYFVIARPARRAILATVMVGALISGTIEVAQIFLPTRDSGTTDILTNMLGTWLGAILYRRTYPLMVIRFPQLNWLFTARC